MSTPTRCKLEVTWNINDFYVECYCVSNSQYAKLIDNSTNISYYLCIILNPQSKVGWKPFKLGYVSIFVVHRNNRFGNIVVCITPNQLLKYGKVLCLEGQSGSWFILTIMLLLITLWVEMVKTNSTWKQWGTLHIVNMSTSTMFQVSLIS